MTIGNTPKATFSIIFNQTHNWYENLWQDSRQGNLNEIKSRIEQFHIKLEDFPSEFAGCFMIAAKEGHKDIIDFFLSVNALKVIGLKQLVHGLNSGLDQAPVLKSHKEILDAVIDSIKLDQDPSRLYEVFKAALANDCIKAVEAITKSIDPMFLYDALKSMLEKKCIESEGFTTSRYYKDLIEAIINSLTPELSWKIIKINAGLTDNSMKVIKAITKSIDPSFLYNALKSSLEEKNHAEDPSALEYHKNLIATTIDSLTPELSRKVLKSCFK
ncbi:hypothetical protein [Candidatus Rhabdochlamydia sp. T3358]|uniref:hypothetical protein n=1 Tax=Candidatus Rhabdochlamydia sp. T3358 TaxID=2099795 RepID=UPI0010B5071B|nr:hypothetical protein [Candidatus Rhabdochlamydia sp. T3358]VHO03654.1 hypothetical protein RHT_01011 [Candidatus Rhabdochlamydia sp. T3358]